MKNLKSCFRVTSVVLFLFAIFACSDDSHDESPDQGVTMVSDASHDASEPPDTADTTGEDEDMCQLFEGCPCVRNTDCPRGSVCQSDFDNRCVTVTGCTVWNEVVARDTGCYYDHDESLVGISGYFGYPECTMDDECDEENPYCIRQICHRNPPCETDDDCEADDQRCFRGIICADEDRL